MIFTETPFTTYIGCPLFGLRSFKYGSGIALEKTNCESPHSVFSGRSASSAFDVLFLLHDSCW